MRSLWQRVRMFAYFRRQKRSARACYAMGHLTLSLGKAESERCDVATASPDSHSNLALSSQGHEILEDHTAANAGLHCDSQQDAPLILAREKLLAPHSNSHPTECRPCAANCCF